MPTSPSANWLQASGTVDMTDAATLAALLGATATSLSSTAPGSVTVPTADQLTATAQLLGRVNTLALAASSVQARVPRSATEQRVVYRMAGWINA